MADLLERIQASKKYQALPQETIERMIHWASQRYHKPKEIEKAARRKLHQVFGAYLDQLNLTALNQTLDDLTPDTNPEDLKNACLKMMLSHTSTRERLPFLASLYTQLFAQIGPQKRVLDLCCGLNPLSWPWFAEQIQSYRGLDLDRRLAALCNRFFDLQQAAAQVEAQDIFSLPETLEADLVLILKTLPCLEQQVNQAGLTLLKKIQAPWVLLSFPNQSLTGKAKGMQATYSNYCEDLLAPLDWQITAHWPFETEDFYLCHSPTMAVNL